MRRSSASLLLAAAVLFAGCGSDDAGTSGTSKERVLPGVETIDDVELAKDRELRWAKVEGAASYRVSLLDSDGRALWAGSSDEPSLMIPPHVMLPKQPRVVVAALDDEDHVLASGASRA